LVLAVSPDTHSSTPGSEEKKRRIRGCSYATRYKRELT
jgi:hypothetical protein